MLLSRFLILFQLLVVFNVKGFHIFRVLNSMRSSSLHNHIDCTEVQWELPDCQPLRGSVALVGAGPGDPDLLTVQAIKLINNASLVISDRLVSPEILSLIKCELRIARKQPGCAEEAQEEIYEWVKEAVHAGKNVVRLKIGDPFLFGRGGEEILEFRKLGVEPIVAAGVSSSYAAPLYANIPLTHRGVASQVVITTGYGRDSSIIELPPYSDDRTVVMLMAIGRLREIAGNMTAIGYPVDTPVAILEKATTPQQRTLSGTLADIADIAEREGAKAPATIVVGEVVRVLHKDARCRSSTEVVVSIATDAEGFKSKAAVEAAASQIFNFKSVEVR